MTTTLPSAAIYYGAEPFTNPTFSFQTHAESARLLNCPQLYDRVLLDVGRRYPGQYLVDWLAWYASNPALSRSLMEFVLFLLLHSKPVTLYVGGIHSSNSSAWQSRMRAMTFARDLHTLLEPIAPFKGAANFSIAFDGSSFGGAFDPAVYMVHSAKADGHNVVVEGVAPEGHPLRSCPSVTTAASAAVESAQALASQPDPENHGVLVTNQQGLANIPAWRRFGHPVYLASSGIREGALPDYWTNSSAVDGGVPEAA